jgi:RHS repeat-associated protein
VKSAAGYGYYRNDHLGTPQQVVGKNGGKVWEGEYRAFGGVKSETGSWDNRLRFPGQYYDQETGNYYNYFRDYDPATGRYLQSDPIGLDGGLNTYAYVKGNPLRYSDRFGLFLTSCDSSPQAAAVCAEAIQTAQGVGGSTAASTAKAAAAAAAGAAASSSSEKKCDDDDCDKLISEVKRALKQVRRSYRNQIRNKGKGTEAGHAESYHSYQRWLRKAIRNAEAKGCPVPVAAYDWAWRPFPPAGGV